MGHNAAASLQSPAHTQLHGLPGRHWSVAGVCTPRKATLIALCTVSNSNFLHAGRGLGAGWQVKPISLAPLQVASIVSVAIIHGWPTGCSTHGGGVPALLQSRTDFDPREGTFKACRGAPTLPPSNLRFLSLWRSKKEMPDESVTLVTQLTIERCAAACLADGSTACTLLETRQIFQRRMLTSSCINFQEAFLCQRLKSCTLPGCRLDMLRDLCHNWHDRIAAVVCVPFVAGFGAASLQHAAANGSSEATLIDTIFHLHHKAESQATGCALDLELIVQDVASWNDPALGRYPVNAVRNRALMLAQSEAVLLLDVDFLPSTSLLASYRGSSTAYASLMERLVEGKTALVLPAFGYADFRPLPNGTDERSAADSVLLTSKELMVEAYMSRRMPSFYEVENPADHGPTNYTRWVNATIPYKIIYERGYEPYVLVAKRYVPWFDERFIGYYRNKVEHLEHLYSFGVTFAVHPYAFVMHRPHLKSATFQVTEALSGRSMEHLMRMKQLHAGIQECIANGTFIPVTSFGHRCPLHVPLGHEPVIADEMNLKKWRRAEVPAKSN